MNRRQHEFLSRNYIWLWLALAFQAGFANAGGFLACARYVSHMTGFGTQVGISMARSEWWLAIEMLTAPASFILGAMLSAWFVDRRILSGSRPRYLLVMFAMTVVFSLVAYGGAWGAFGDFGEPLVLSRDFILLGLLCFVCGLQNACFTSLSRGQIRTTHLTGISTDIGIAWVRLLSLKRASREFKLLKRVNMIRMGTFAAFSIGSMISAVVFTSVKYEGFKYLAIWSLGLFCIMGYMQLRVDRKKSAIASYTQQQQQHQAA